MLDRYRIIPRFLRIDCGTETIDTATLQSTFFAYLNDLYDNAFVYNAPALPAHVYGRSPDNIPIENYWYWFHGYRGDHIADYFAAMVAQGDYITENIVHRSFLLHLFAPLVDAMLQDYRHE